MFRKPVRLLVLSFVVVVLSLPSIVQAHGEIIEGDYELTIGFRNEPAYEGEPNGLELRVVRHAEETETDEHAEEEGEEHTEESVAHESTEVPVSGLEETLQVEIIHGSSRRELELRPVFGEEGVYTADVLPVAEGDYTWRIWGDIEGTSVDVELTSGPDTFSPIRSKDEVAFPAAEPTGSDLAQQMRTTQLIGIAGVVLGLIGTVLGVMGLRRRGN